MLLGIHNDAQRLSGATGGGFGGLFCKRGRYDLTFEIYQSIAVGLENLGTELHTYSVPAAAFAVREDPQRYTLRSSIQLSHFRPLTDMHQSMHTKLNSVTIQKSYGFACFR
jgi:hypothetical protein